MRKNFRHSVSMLLVVVMMVCALPLTASATTEEVEIRASYQLSRYSVSVSNVRSGIMQVTATVVGTAPMDTIGAQTIVVEKQVGNRWQEDCRFTAKYTYDSLTFLGNYEFTVIPGVTYRATLTAYAKDYNGGSDTGSVTSG